MVNDGSTDKTARIIEDYRHVLESDITRFIYISQENEGVGAACNNALKKVTGEFLPIVIRTIFGMQTNWKNPGKH